MQKNKAVRVYENIHYNLEVQEYASVCIKEYLFVNERI